MHVYRAAAVSRYAATADCVELQEAVGHGDERPLQPRRREAALEELAESSRAWLSFPKTGATTAFHLA